MGDPNYYRYSAAAAERGSVSRPSFPGYFTSEAPSLASQHADMQYASSDVQKRDINRLQPWRYGVDDISNSGVYSEPNLGGLSARDTVRSYPSSLGDPKLTAQRWDAPEGVYSSVGVHPEPTFGGVSAGSAIRGYSSALEVPGLVGHRQDAPGISPSSGVHPEPRLGAVSAAATDRSYSSAPEVPNSVGQRWDAPVGISPSAGLQSQPSCGAGSAGASIKGYTSALDDQRRDGPVGISSSAGVQPEPSLGAVSAGASIKGCSSPLEDPNLVGQRQDGTAVMRPGIPDAVDEMPASLRNGDGPQVDAGESNILFVDGLPTDCTRREVGHLFRPFLGYKEIKVIHKEPRHSGDRAMVLCFVEFHDSKFARAAMQALQGYKFDDKKPDSPALRVQFAHFPFRYRADRDDQCVEF
ncbi:RNA-binding family protein isoform 1 [Theobroma cacao]|uniref:RNA-binding family protein isoform 1 n=1 Tax=Theobroma cacao TaxID=3641 RepID=A0A061GLC3_THECC|nr:RNA-binding family protein isoform 1 [Theobroma cacao]